MQQTALVTMAIALVCALVVSALGGFAVYSQGSSGASAPSAGVRNTSPSPRAAPSSGDAPYSAGGGGSGADAQVPGTPVDNAFRVVNSGMPLWLTASPSGSIVTAAGRGNLQMRVGACDGVASDGVKRYAVRNTTTGQFLLQDGRGGLSWGPFSAPEGCFVRELTACEAAFPGKGYESLRAGNHVLRIPSPTLGSTASLVAKNTSLYNANSQARMAEVCIKP